MQLLRPFRNQLLLLLSLTLASCSLIKSGSGSSYQVIKSTRNEYSISNDIAPDSSIINTYLPYKGRLEAEMSKVIGHSALLLSKKSSDTLPESLLSNFFADAVTEQALKLDPNIDFAIPTTKGGLRVDFPKGDITTSHVFELMPFENELYVFTLKGEDVQRLLNFIAGTNGQPVSRLRMKIANKLPVDVWINGKPFDPNKSYSVLTTDYISGGGDHTVGFEKPISKTALGLKVRNALMNYVKETEAAGKIINSKTDGRITKI
ncbi:5'-nucleotidase C-terminal domain-containing protein [Pedobacter metabolipauper]|uniref:5'-nucleotidase-like protein n=1 Tax=Pedobacter metabolipauper TaxID=425513 RepID=A0A4V3D1L7_9SPHI|nr:5'-nucleotidase [Pedobacter metabolipauper]TDQ11663.1 5'-nucleotidase-like protein [Pedobacter metabolipauper]